jgi:8-oxo-dGTP diphosphatase
MSSGDGWTQCASGHRHWGLFGAAGLLIVDHESDRVILQHRAPWTHQGDSWGIPGGARDSDETAVQAALREAREEADLQAADIDPIGLYVDDHRGWAYTTVVARPLAALFPVAANAESVSVSWHQVGAVAGLPLHSGFAAAWQHLRDVPAPLYLIAVGSAAGDPVLERLSRVGVAVSALPTGMHSGGLSRLLPRVVEIPNSEDLGPAIVRYSVGGQVLVATDADELGPLL